jgi:hypothetical protein
LCKWFLELETSTHTDNAALVFDCVEQIYLTKPEPVRHPDETKWWGRPGTMSIDQLVPLVICLRLYGFHQITANLLYELQKRNGFAWNSRHIWPEGKPEKKMPADNMYLHTTFHALFYRGLIPKWRQIIWDIPLLISTLVRIVYGAVNKNSTGPDLNLVNKLIFSSVFGDNAVAKLARYVYFRHRDVKGVFGRYFWHGFRHPPMWEVVGPTIELIRNQDL